MFRQLEQIPYIKDLINRLKQNPYMCRAYGYESWTPCKAHFTQIKRWIGVEVFKLIESWLRLEALRLRKPQL